MLDAQAEQPSGAAKSISRKVPSCCSPETSAAPLQFVKTPFDKSPTRSARGIGNGKSASREYEVQARSARPVLLEPLIRLLRFWCLPLARIPRTQNGVDHRHVFECILKRNRHVSISANRSGEDVALNRVLVADRKSWVAMPLPNTSRPSSIRMRHNRSLGALNGISISIRPRVPRKWLRW